LGRTHRKYRFHRYSKNTSIVACLFVAAGTCLPRRCLAMNVYSDFTIPASRRHVIVLLLSCLAQVRIILQNTRPHVLLLLCNNREKEHALLGNGH
jgi:hypothetical protein